MRYEVTDVTDIVKYIGKSVFRDQNAGEASPPPRNPCLGGGGGLYSAAYEHKDCEQSLIFLLSHCRLKTHVRGK